MGDPLLLMQAGARQVSQSPTPVAEPRPVIMKTYSSNVSVRVGNVSVRCRALELAAPARA